MTGAGWCWLLLAGTGGAGWLVPAVLAGTGDPFKFIVLHLFLYPFVEPSVKQSGGSNKSCPCL